MPFVVPTYGHGMQGGGALGAAFAVLSLLTPDRNRGIPDPARRVPRGYLVSKGKALEWFPNLERDRLTGAGVFFDGQMYNPPRLVWAFVRSALKAGAVAANYCEVAGFLRRDCRVTGVVVEDRLGGDKFEVRGRVVINAAGPYADALLARTGIRPRSANIPFSRDMALVIRRPLVTTHALALQTRYHDPSAVLSRGRRHIFLVPWVGSTLIRVTAPSGGTTPTRSVHGRGGGRVPRGDQRGRPSARAHPRRRRPGDGGPPADRPGQRGRRCNQLRQASAPGGQRAGRRRGRAGDRDRRRYTIARGTCEAVDLAVRKLGRSAARSRSAVTALYGGLVPRFDRLVGEVAAELPAGVPAGVAERLAHNHGSAYGDVLRVGRERPDWNHPIPGTAVLRAEVIHAIRSEMACRLSDCVFRRTDLATTGDPGPAALEAAADLAAGELGWSPERRADELRQVRARFPFTGG
jgi:glycerol-3-phosphate dehydrogenase